jgi:hypothetical protein
MTQSGHPVFQHYCLIRYDEALWGFRCCHEAARVHHSSWWRGDVVVHGARQAAGYAGDWLLGSATASGWAPQVRAFHQGLNDGGYVEGRNVAIEARWADNQYDRLPAMAAELVQRRVALIAAFSTPAASAAKVATATIPIVFSTTADPVQMGFVASLNRPGGNMTGATIRSVEVGAKLLELPHEAVPSAKVMALLVNPTNPQTDALPPKADIGCDLSANDPKRTSNSADTGVDVSLLCPLAASACRQSSRPNAKHYP